MPILVLFDSAGVLFAFFMWVSLINFFSQFELKKVKLGSRHRQNFLSEWLVTGEFY